GATLGIVGLGRIGSAVPQRARGFEMRVLHYRRTATGEPGYRALEDLLRESDLVSLHTPLTAETTGLVSRERLALLRDGATLVNTARGAIVDEDALVEELVSGRILAGLDVFAAEPRVPKRLLELPNVVLTPHVASATVETRAAMTRVLGGEGGGGRGGTGESPPQTTKKGARGGNMVSPTGASRRRATLTQVTVPTGPCAQLAQACQ